MKKPQKIAFSAPVSLSIKITDDKFAQKKGRPARITMKRGVKDNRFYFYCTCHDTLGNQITFFIPQKEILFASLLRIYEEPYLKNNLHFRKIKHMTNASEKAKEWVVRKIKELNDESIKINYKPKGL